MEQWLNITSIDDIVRHHITAGEETACDDLVSLALISAGQIPAR